MFHQKKVIIFDMDGTLIDSVGIWNAVDKELIARLGGETLPEENIQQRRDELLRTFSHTQDAYLAYCNFLAQTYNATLSKEEIRAMRYAIAQHYLKNVIDFKPNAHTLLHYLKEQGYQLVIASTTSQNNLNIYIHENNAMRQKVDFEKTFSLILGREVVRKIKPHPEVHYVIMQELKAEPHECLVVEDSLVGVEAAHNAGIEVITIFDTYAKNDEAELRKRSLGYFEDFETLLLHVKEELGKKLKI
ncbi:HAD family phosphatase [Sulfurospirillum diekertiae]|uniref:HAD family phosphatase n=1 Tax=Sulfurospirillum diekertiae TaxID=1854492 RepID=A0A858KGP4_9BACT|nr:HAD family phosphatase [Sulfurospirillum diekertiae]QIR76968.2 HAD family phosphatase [Sulfurospirillum diekertiae]QIR79584.2 HAD family phosphatase [Sulfurospirillum diekertiae]